MDIRKLKDTPRAKWFRIVTRGGEFDAQIEPFGNKAWRKVHDRLTAKYKRQMRENDGELPPDIYDPILLRCTAESILVNWRGVRDGDVEVPYSVEAAIDLLADDEVRAAVSKASLDLARTKEHEIEDDAGN